MKVEITTKHENVLLNRQEVSFTVKEATSTPSRKDIRQKLTSLTNTNEKNIAVDVLETKYGTTNAKGKAKIYKSPEDLKKTELGYIKTRNFGKEEEKKEEPKAKASQAPSQTGQSEPPVENGEEKKE